ncbi:MAG: metal ABC transporter permease [Actinomycetota bacterium]
MNALIASMWPVSMLAHPFMRNAFAAGTAIAIAAGLVGYFLVLRAQVFTGDALSHAAFTGAVAALAAGYDLRLGLFVVTVAVAVGMGLLGRSGKADDVVIGAVFVWLLGLGVLFLSIYTASRSGGTRGAAGVGVLFGSVFGLSSSDVFFTIVIVLGISLTVLALARPLLFSTVDAGVAAARGIPVRIIGVAFLGLVGLTAAVTTQAVGALLLLGLLAGPAAAAQRLTYRPFSGLALSVAIAVGVTWGGLILSYEVPRIPPSFAIVALAVSAHAASRLVPRHGPSPGILTHSHS